VFSELWIHALGARVGGGLTYLRAVLPELLAQAPGVRLIVLLPAEVTDLPTAPGLELVRPRAAAANALSRMVFDQCWLPWRLSRRPHALLYCTGSFAPWRRVVPTIVLLRNAIYFDAAYLARETARRRCSYRLQARIIARGARGADRVTYPSASMRALVESRHPELRAKGLINLYGVGELFLAAGARLQAGGGQDPPTFLYVMTYTLQKNLTVLLRALLEARRLGLRLRVLVTSNLQHGPPASFAADRELWRAHRLIEEGYLVPVGPREGQALLQLYLQADACVFPSICESFGHPLVEALALGKPLLCADRPYARELCGGHAVYFDPDRPEQLLELWRGWPGSAAAGGRAPLDRLRETYSWSAHARRLLECAANLARDRDGCRPPNLGAGAGDSRDLPG
jgi:glycosyltransferase involved in cell wall biosynthesis